MSFKFLQFSRELHEICHPDMPGVIKSSLFGGNILRDFPYKSALFALVTTQPANFPFTLRIALLHQIGKMTIRNPVTNLAMLT